MSLDNAGLDELRAAVQELTLEVEQLRAGQQQLANEKSALERSAQAKEQFLAYVSHELRTPMNGILGLTGLALDTDLNDEQRHYLRLVWSSAESLLTIVNDLLDRAKLEAGRLEIEHIAFNLRLALEDTLTPLQVSATAKNLTLDLVVDPEVPVNVIGDPGRFRQIITNLVGNAIKFTSRGGVTVDVLVEDTTAGSALLSIAVTDTGIGIPAEQLGTIFDPFQQAAASTSRVFGGTGLGLSISSQLVRALGGDIRVDSEVDKGSSFIFTVRVGVQRESDHLPGPLSPDDKPRVLVVTDSAIHRRMLVDVFGDDRFVPLIVESQDDALDRLRSAAIGKVEPFAVLLLDLQMDAIEAAAKVLADPVATGVRVIVLTPAGQRGDAARCRDIGVAGYLTGPLVPPDLVAAIHAVLENPADLVTRYWLREQRPRLTVLVVDDSPTNRLLARRILERDGHIVVEAGGGAVALDELESTAFDAVLLDLEMPEMDGFETARRIRSLPEPTASLPVAALTGHMSDEHRHRASEAGMDGFINKPFRSNELLAIIHELTADWSRPIRVES